MTYKKGIDISEHNGVIDWETVKKYGQIDFAMLRAGYGPGGWVDKQFHRNARECNRLGIPIGVYYFSYAKSAADAEEEAGKCIAIIKDYKIDYPVVYDFEDDSVRICKNAGVNIIGKDFATSCALNFLNRIAEAGYVPMLYSNPAYLNQYFDEKRLLNGFCSLWLAQWPYGEVNLAIPPKQNPSIWQYSAIGRCRRIQGNVDLNVSYVDFFQNENEGENDVMMMTNEEFKKKMNEAYELGKQASWAEKEIEKAKEMGFTDGSRPYEFASRAEVMVMIERAISGISTEENMENHEILVDKLEKLTVNLSKLVDIIHKKVEKIS